MDWLTFIASLIESLAWPTAVVLLVWVLRRPLNALLPLLQHLRYKEFEIDFGRQVGEVSEDIARKLPGETVLTLPSDEEARLADISPRLAVLEAWIQVETATLGAARAAGNEGLQNKAGAFQALRILEQHGSLDPGIVSLIRVLQELRNEAAHAPDFALSKESALEYAASARAVARYLKKVADVESNDR